MIGLTKEIKPIETVYKGYKFRSRLEARWAVFFDLMKIEWEYEEEGYLIDKNTGYLPDFYLPQFHTYFEVKRKYLSEEERETAIEKISYGMRNDEWAGIICFGDPVDDELYIYCQANADEYTGMYEHKISFGYMGEPILIAEDNRVLLFYDKMGGDTILIYTDGIIEALSCGECKSANVYKGLDYQIAAVKARQARFEHGEKPNIQRRNNKWYF